MNLPTGSLAGYVPLLSNTLGALINDHEIETTPAIEPASAEALIADNTQSSESGTSAPTTVHQPMIPGSMETQPLEEWNTSNEQSLVTLSDDTIDRLMADWGARGLALHDVSA